MRSSISKNCGFNIGSPPTNFITSTSSKSSFEYGKVSTVLFKTLRSLYPCSARMFSSLLQVVLK